MSKFASYAKSKGFLETLQILGDCDHHEAPQPEFFQKLLDHGTYYNAYLRVKKILTSSQLIGFKLNDHQDKVIFLTPKGLAVLERVQAIEAMLTA